MWLRLLGTIVIGFFIGGILRGIFTDRRTVLDLHGRRRSLFLGLTTYGWRLVWTVSSNGGSGPLAP